MLCALYIMKRNSLRFRCFTRSRYLRFVPCWHDPALVANGFDGVIVLCASAFFKAVYHKRPMGLTCKKDVPSANLIMPCLMGARVPKSPYPVENRLLRGHDTSKQVPKPQCFKPALPSPLRMDSGDRIDQWRGLNGLSAPMFANPPKGNAGKRGEVGDVWIRRIGRKRRMGGNQAKGVSWRTDRGALRPTLVRLILLACGRSSSGRCPTWHQGPGGDRGTGCSRRGRQAV